MKKASKVTYSILLVLLLTIPLSCLVLYSPCYDTSTIFVLVLFSSLCIQIHAKSERQHSVLDYCITKMNVQGLLSRLVSRVGIIFIYQPIVLEVNADFVLH